jgi:hypothetical protein
VVPLVCSLDIAAAFPPRMEVPHVCYVLFIYGIRRSCCLWRFCRRVGGIAAIVLAIIGLAGIRPEILVSIATVVFGAALLIQGGAMLSELAQIERLEAISDANVHASGGGLSTLFLVGVAGIVLGVLALLGVHAPVLTAISAIGFGAALVISSAAVWQLLTRSRGRSPVTRIMATEVASEAAVRSPGSWPPKSLPAPREFRQWPGSLC